MKNKLLYSILFLLVIFILGILAAEPLYHASSLKKGEAITFVIFFIALLTGIFGYFLYKRSVIHLLSWLIAGIIGATILNTTDTFLYLSSLYLGTAIIAHRLSKKRSLS